MKDELTLGAAAGLGPMSVGVPVWGVAILPSSKLMVVSSRYCLFEFFFCCKLFDCTNEEDKILEFMVL